MTPAAETGLFLDGLRCAGCVARVERALREAPGVIEAAANYTTHRALVRFDPDATTPAQLVAAVDALGYAATPFDPGSLDGDARRGAREALTRLLVAAFLAGNVMLVSAALYIGAYQHLDAATRVGLRWLAIGLSLPAVTWCALPFWRGALAGLRRREITMDVPIVLGIATAFSVSIAGTLAEASHLYMDSAAMIVFLILLGRTLERGARARAASAVDRLAALTPHTALRRTPTGFETVPATSLAAGDRVVVAAGERVPADGHVLAGASEVDESMLTGESRPVLRGPGDAVTGGTHNTLAEFEVEIDADVRSGTLARLAALLERAQTERPQVQRTADRIAAVFAPSVVALALLTATAWLITGAAVLDAALAAAAVLIVACPCALGLATPAAVTAAVGRAASLGILVKSGEALERCASVDAALLDKTGTITDGGLAVESVAPAAGLEPDQVLEVAARAEGASTHPVAVALRRAAAERGLDATATLSRQTLPGRGVIAGEGESALRVGSLSHLEEAGLRPAPELAEAADKLGERGLSLAWVAEGSRVIGAIALSDPPRADARDAVARLARLGLSVALVSGDHAPAVSLAARRSGIADASAAVTPEGKVERVRALRARGARIIVAGDGINDAAALSAADVGVAMARGSGATLHAADVVIRAPRLGALADCIELSRATLRRIRENLGFALAYNAIAVPLAMLGVLAPLHAAVAMSLSSLVVTANAVRLLRWRAST
jgi:heavy metal translocating P-type ATPase